MSNTCYVVLLLFLFDCFSQVATNFTFTAETSLILLLLKNLPSNARQKSLVKFVDHKLEEAFSDGILDLNWDTSFYSVSQFLNNFPDLPRLTSLLFSIGR